MAKKTRTPKHWIWPVIPAAVAGMVANVIFNIAPADNANQLFMHSSGIFGIFVGLGIYWAIRTYIEYFEWVNGKIVYYE